SLFQATRAAWSGWAGGVGDALCSCSFTRIASRQQLGQRADDAVGPDRRTLGQPEPVAVIPDRIDAEALRRDDLPFEIVADHPGLVRRDAERSERMAIGLLLRLAEAVLALDLDVVEAVLQGKALDLGALRRSRAIGDERELDAEFLQPIERLVRAREHAQLGMLEF